MTLRLVHPTPDGNPSRRQRGRSSTLSFTPAERQHFVAAMRGLRRAYGTWQALAGALGLPMNTVHRAGSSKSSRGGLALAVRAAQLAGIPVEAMLKGLIVEAGTCPTCGARVGDRPGAGGAR